MIDLYTFGTGNGWRASIALEECGLPYRAHKIDITKGEQAGEAYRAINPAATIPAIVDSDGPNGQPITIAESGAILLYCAEKSGKFLPADPAKRMAALQWVFHAVSGAGEPISGLFRLQRVPETHEAVFNFLRGRLTNFLKAADRHLEGQTYLVDEISIADFAFYPIAAMGKNMVGIEGMPNLERWLNLLSAREGIQKGMAVPT